MRYSSVSVCALSKCVLFLSSFRCFTQTMLACFSWLITLLGALRVGIPDISYRNDQLLFAPLLAFFFLTDYSFAALRMCTPDIWSGNHQLLICLLSDSTGLLTTESNLVSLVWMSVHSSLVFFSWLKYSLLHWKCVCLIKWKISWKWSNAYLVHCSSSFIIVVYSSCTKSFIFLWWVGYVISWSYNMGHPLHVLTENKAERGRCLLW